MTEVSGLTAKTIGGRDIVFRELTVGQVRAMTVSTREYDTLNEMLFEEIALPDIPKFTSLTSDDLEQMVPSDIRLVIDACKERNPHFFGMLARLNQGSKA